MRSKKLKMSPDMPVGAPFSTQIITCRGYSGSPHSVRLAETISANGMVWPTGIIIPPRL